MNFNKSLLIIAPKGPDSACGVSDYAYQIANEFSQYYDHVAIGTQADKPTASGNRKIEIKNWRKLLGSLKSGEEGHDLILNYTPTSYAKTGIATNLLAGLKKFKGINPANRVFIIFHETWNGNPKLKLHHLIKDKFTKWSSAQLGKMASGIAAVTQEQIVKLNELTGKDVVILPVGANVYPEKINSGLESIRENGTWIIFGLSHTRLWTLKKYSSLINVLHQAGVLKSIKAIGPIGDHYAKEEAEYASENLPIGVYVQAGTLTTLEISNQLLTAQASFINQTADSLRKSGTFAAMAAHAIAVICEAPETLADPPGAGLIRPSELLANPELINSPEYATRTQLLHNWFWSNVSWHAVVNKMMLWLKN